MIDEIDISELTIMAANMPKFSKPAIARYNTPQRPTVSYSRAPAHLAFAGVTDSALDEIASRGLLDMFIRCLCYINIQFDDFSITYSYRDTERKRWLKTIVLYKALVYITGTKQLGEIEACVNKRDGYYVSPECKAIVETYIKEKLEEINIQFQAITTIDATYEINRWIVEEDPKHWKDLGQIETVDRLKMPRYSHMLITTCLRAILYKFSEGTEYEDVIVRSANMQISSNCGIRGIGNVYRACAYLSGVTSMKDMVAKQPSCVCLEKLELVARYLTK